MLPFLPPYSFNRHEAERYGLGLPHWPKNDIEVAVRCVSHLSDVIGRVSFPRDIRVEIEESDRVSSIKGAICEEINKCETQDDIRINSGELFHGPMLGPELKNFVNRTMAGTALYMEAHILPRASDDSLDVIAAKEELGSGREAARVISPVTGLEKQNKKNKKLDLLYPSQACPTLAQETIVRHARKFAPPTTMTRDERIRREREAEEAEEEEDVEDDAGEEMMRGVNEEEEEVVDGAQPRGIAPSSGIRYDADGDRYYTATEEWEEE
ncbi:hypothetical protein EJ03DRAFT_352330 [Teratosphaeria nubilosa]|uniref:Uncharacterized protein n=1 Tax=Teratosphaeria nubilosa TaxID=161662 RepID=A0A6G1L5U6_9PEZI|nr:hypothetical protein EJ03DRAFT_352330 [Teratosphaeria nubilosa]